MKRVSSILAGLAMIGLAATAARADDFYQIQVGGINVVYTQSTGDVCDTGSGGTGCLIVTGFGNNVNVADNVNTMSFLLNGTQVLLLSTPGTLKVDILVDLPSGTNPTVNQTVASAGFGVVDFLVNGLPGIATNISTGSVTFSNGGVNMTGTGFSTIFAQNLITNPALGWTAGNPINWSFSSGGAGVCTGAAGQQVCTYAGTGELSWSVKTPEPASMLLFGLGLAGLGFWGRKRVN